MPLSTARFWTLRLFSGGYPSTQQVRTSEKTSREPPDFAVEIVVMAKHIQNSAKSKKCSSAVQAQRFNVMVSEEESR